jgi:hypothetical protein
MDAHARSQLAPDRPPSRPRAKVISLEHYRRRGVPHQDVLLNAEWDRLSQLAEEAWTWRDPETLAALGACVARLGLRSLEEWQL